MLLMGKCIFYILVIPKISIPTKKGDDNLCQKKHICQ